LLRQATRERFIFPYQEQCSDSTVDFLQRAFIYYGYKPKITQTDNGIEFTYLQQTKRDKKHKWLSPKDKRKELLLLDWGIVE